MKKILNQEEAKEFISDSFAPLRVGFDCGFVGDPIGFCIYPEDPGKERFGPFSIEKKFYSDEGRLVKAIGEVKQRISE